MTIQEYLAERRAKRNKATQPEPEKRQVNKVPASNIFGGFGFENPLNGCYSDAYMWLIFKQIFSGVKNVRFFYEDTIADATARKKVGALIDFIDTNANLLLWYWWTNGYIVADYDRNGKLYIPKQSDIKKDKDGNVIGRPLVYYSDAYLMKRKSDFQIIAENVRNLDRLKNGDAYITQTLSVFGILSGSNELPINPADKDDFLRTWRENIGITRDKNQFAILQNPVNFQQVDFHIKDLQFGEKIKDEVQLIAGYFGVPYDLLPMSGKSTYDNQRQALRNFYSQCVSPVAEVLLKFARHIIKCDDKLRVLSSRLTFAIDNVPELEDDRTATIEYKLKVIDAITKLKDAGEEIPADLKKDLYGSENE